MTNRNLVLGPNHVPSSGFFRPDPCRQEHAADEGLGVSRRNVDDHGADRSPNHCLQVFAYLPYMPAIHEWGRAYPRPGSLDETRTESPPHQCNVPLGVSHLSLPDELHLFLSGILQKASGSNSSTKNSVRDRSSSCSTIHSVFTPMQLH